MVFSSVEFIFLFLPLAVGAVWLAPKRLKNLAIFFVSLIFYAWGGLLHLPLLLLVTALDFALALLIFRARRAKKLCLALAVGSNILILFFFKYFDTAIGLFGLSPLGIILPIGISFYIFQALSYVVDVFRGEVEPTRDPVTFGAYLTLFPQLIAGPIVKYREISDTLAHPTRPPAWLVASGIRTFFSGLAKKVFFANTASAMWDRISGLAEADRTVMLSWLGLIFYSLFIYFDFSGYSDMAIGLGKLFGFRFPENFEYPYISKSPTEFWRRWHITLSSFFREYLYIPLGGNRRGRARTYFNLFCVWILTGIWHGATPNFAIWGLYWFVLLVFDKAFLSRWLARAPRAFSHALTLLFIGFGWLIFAFDDGSAGLSYLRSLFSPEFFSFSDIYELVRHIPFLFLAFFACTPYPKRLFYGYFHRYENFAPLSAALCILTFFFCVIYLVSSNYNPFLYFRF